MTALAAANGARLLPAHAAMWRIDPSSTTFELSVYHDLALIRATKSFRRIDGLLVRDQAGNVGIGISLDTATLEPASNDTDPRRGSYKLFHGSQAAHPLALFAFTGATVDGEGTLRVADGSAPPGYPPGRSERPHGSSCAPASSRPRIGTSHGRRTVRLRRPTRVDATPPVRSRLIGPPSS